MGFGAMQLPGPGVFGPPKDRDQAVAILRRVVEAGVNHIDTAQFYGPDVANELIREALYPYPEDLVLVSKVGAARDDQGRGSEHNAPRSCGRGSKPTSLLSVWSRYRWSTCVGTLVSTCPSRTRWPTWWHCATRG